MGYLQDAMLFLVNVFFGLLMAVLVLRFLFEYCRIPFNHPIVQTIYKVTAPLLRPLHRFIPRWKSADLATLLLLLVVQMLENWIVVSMSQFSPTVAGILLMSIGDLMALVVYVFIISIIVQVVLSWVNPDPYNPISNLVHNLNAPLLAPAQKMIPPIGVIDISALVVLLGLQLVLILVTSPIRDMGISLLA